MVKQPKTRKTGIEYRKYIIYLCVFETSDGPTVHQSPRVHKKQQSNLIIVKTGLWYLALRKWKIPWKYVSHCCIPSLLCLTSCFLRFPSSTNTPPAATYVPQTAAWLFFLRWGAHAEKKKPFEPGDTLGNKKRPKWTIYLPLHTCLADFFRQTKSKTHTDYFQTLQCYDMRDECFSKAFDYVKEKSGTTTLSFFMMTRSWVVRRCVATSLKAPLCSCKFFSTLIGPSWRCQTSCLDVVLFWLEKSSETCLCSFLADMTFLVGCTPVWQQVPDNWHASDSVYAMD